MEETFGKRHLNSKFQHRSSSAVEVLKKQIDLEKSTLKYHNLSQIPEEIAEQEEQGDHFQSLVNELGVATKKRPSFKEALPTLLASKSQDRALSKQQSKLNQSNISGKEHAHLKRLLPPSNRFKEHNHELDAEYVEKLMVGSREKFNKTMRWPQLECFHALIPKSKDNDQIIYIDENLPKTLETATDLEAVGVQLSLANCKTNHFPLSTCIKIFIVLIVL
ncbi:uncharacterized protein ACN2A1_010260 [Glossina fuscipes fuscipes]|nr:hypothetical protein GQX74_000175 [Glossina fuscipes]